MNGSQTLIYGIYWLMNSTLRPTNGSALMVSETRRTFVPPAVLLTDASAALLGYCRPVRVRGPSNRRRSGDNE